MKLEDLQPVHGGLRHNPNPATLDMISFELDCTVDLIFGVHELMERGRCDAAGYKAALWATACHLQTICGELHKQAPFYVCFYCTTEQSKCIDDTRTLISNWIGGLILKTQMNLRFKNAYDP